MRAHCVLNFSPLLSHLILLEAYEGGSHFTAQVNTWLRPHPGLALREPLIWVLLGDHPRPP